MVKSDALMMLEKKYYRIRDIQFCNRGMEERKRIFNNELLKQLEYAKCIIGNMSENCDFIILTEYQFYRVNAENSFMSIIVNNDFLKIAILNSKNGTSRVYISSSPLELPE